MYLLDLFEGKGGERAVQFRVCGSPLNDSANGGYVDALFTCGEYRFSSFWNLSCSEEKV